MSLKRIIDNRTGKPATRERLTEIIEYYRGMGYSWEQIAIVLGTTRQWVNYWAKQNNLETDKAIDQFKLDVRRERVKWDIDILGQIHD